MSNAAITSRPFKPAMACERCVFGTGDHALWCPQFNIRNFVTAFEGAGQTLCSAHPKPQMLTGRDAYNAIFNVGAQRSDAFIEYCSALIRLGPPPNEPPAGPWADLFAQPKEKP